MRVNADAILPDSDVIHKSICGMKRDVYELRFAINPYPKKDGTIRFKLDYDYSKRAALARRIIKLERIIKEMEIIELIAMARQLLKAA